MGAIFSPLTGNIPAAAPAPAPAPIEPAVDPAEAEREAATVARRAFLARQKQGRLGTIATSAREVLTPGQLAVARRSLLGE